VPELSFLGLNLENLEVEIPLNTFSADKARFNRFEISGIKGSFDEEIKGSAVFLSYKGQGDIRYAAHDLFEDPSLSFDFKIEGLNLSDFVTSLSEDVYISGIMDVEGKGRLDKKGPAIEITFRSKKERGVKQVMNFGAVKVISSLGGGSPIKAIGSSNFAYSLIAGRATIKEGYLTIEGLAGERSGRQYLVRSGLWGGINLTIDRETNTIKIDELVRIIRKQVGAGF